MRANPFLWILSSLVCTLTATPVYEVVRLTMYWVVHESSMKLGSDTALKTCRGQILANVSHQFALKIRLEGSGVLRNGRIINLSNCKCKPGTDFSCFQEVREPLGSFDNILIPFISIATNGTNFGKTAYSPEMDGWIMPNGLRHNGCLRVDDDCPACSNNHIDFFVWNETNYLDLVRRYPISRLHLSYNRYCQLLNWNNEFKKKLLLS
ncbi:unnamed protein product [Allacma fusca]|uniref:Uncharacterized protein n=1 Tax=Allacma fusca TaxID=39272 RepID=A0A8J2JXT5_9HEXA|nr:unnamed protein product [Allacma fusca]